MLTPKKINTSTTKLLSWKKLQANNATPVKNILTKLCMALAAPLSSVNPSIQRNKVNGAAIPHIKPSKKEKAAINAPICENEKMIALIINRIG